MMKHTILILFLFLSLLCHGQSYKFFTTDRELSSSLINKIYQDRNGMIWIATEDGLNRYDGAKFRALVKGGVKEILVVAQDLTYYGIDLYGKNRLMATSYVLG